MVKDTNIKFIVIKHGQIFLLIYSKTMILNQLNAYVNVDDISTFCQQKNQGESKFPTKVRKR